MKLLLVDDHRLFLAGLKTLLADLPGGAEVLEAADARVALAQVRKHPDLDVILLDLKLPDIDGYALLASLRRDRCVVPSLVVSAVDEPEAVERALAAGASGFVSKSIDLPELMRAFEALERTGTYLSRDVAERLELHREHQRWQGRRLTERQREVLDLVAQGQSNRDIAGRLGLTESTVKGHVSVLFDTLQVKNRTQCVLEARRLGLVRER